ncbi:MAG: iron uptake transporter permease EfeU [Candidatus Nanopelagicales bacterium]
MFNNFLIGLREGLEAALIVSILIAYLVKTGRQHLLPGIWWGVAAAVVLSLGVGAVLTFGTRTLTSQAQEAIGGILSIVAVGLVTAMVFWMASNARHLKGELHAKVDTAAERGSGWALAGVAFVAVAREGLETALFVWSAVRATGGGAAPLIGALLGIAVAVGLGALIYRGALRLNLATFFTWTGVALILVAGGVLAYGIHELQEAGILPGGNNLAFDVGATIAPGSWYAVLLKGTLNLSPAMTVLECVAWLSYVVPVMWLFLRKVRTPMPRRAPAPAPAAATPTQTPTSPDPRLTASVPPRPEENDR